MSAKTGTVTYVGLGNIGGHAAVTLARTGVVRRITLVDPDRYEAHNLRTQAISPRDVGQRKVDVVAREIRRIAPSIAVRTYSVPVESVPMARLHADVIASGLDNLAARRTVSRAAKRLGTPYVDSGVNADAGLARVTLFEPAPTAACAECGWSEAELATLDRRHLCDPQPTRAPTRAPAFLGELAASLQVAECAKLLTGDTAHALLGHELVVGTAVHSHHVSRRERAARCPFDHRRWRITRIAGRACDVTLAKALTLLPGPDPAQARLRMDDDTFVHRLVCQHCNGARDTLRLARRVPRSALGCTRCGGVLVAPGIDRTDTLSRVDSGKRRVSLATLGLCAGDVFTVENGRSQAHFEIGG